MKGGVDVRKGKKRMFNQVPKWSKDYLVIPDEVWLCVVLAEHVVEQGPVTAVQVYQNKQKVFNTYVGSHLNKHFFTVWKKNKKNEIKFKGLEYYE